ASAINSGFGLSANGDRLYLLTAQTQVLDSIVFGIQLEEYSIGRVPDGSANWVLALPTLGTANAAAPMGDFRRLKINEWMPFPASGDDWFELYNPETLPVALGNCYLSDTEANLTKHRVAALSFVGAATNAWKKIVADGNVASGANHVSFKLDNTVGEPIILSDPNG